MRAEPYDLQCEKHAFKEPVPKGALSFGVSVGLRTAVCTSGRTDMLPFHTMLLPLWFDYQSIIAAYPVFPPRERKWSNSLFPCVLACATRRLRLMRSSMLEKVCQDFYRGKPMPNTSSFAWGLRVALSEDIQGRRL